MVRKLISIGLLVFAVSGISIVNASSSHNREHMSTLSHNHDKKLWIESSSYEGAYTQKMFTKMGKGHSERDPGYWVRNYGNFVGSNMVPLASCASVAEKDNLENPALYLHNVGRCKSGIQTRIKWSDDLESKAHSYIEGVFDFMDYVFDGKKINLRVNRFGIMKNVILMDTVREYFEKYGTFHTLLPNFNRYTYISKGNNTYCNYEPLGQSYSIVSILSEETNTVRNYNKNNKAIKLYHLSSYAPHNISAIRGTPIIGSAEYSIVHTFRELLRSGVVSLSTWKEMLVPSNDLFSSEGNSYSRPMEEIVLPFLRPEYFGNLDPYSEEDVTVTQDEIMAAYMHLNFYEAEKKTFSRIFGEGNENIPLVSKNSFYSPEGYPIGHYYQYIWENSEYVGCSYSLRFGIIFTACLYDRTGNIVGDSARSVGSKPHNKSALLGTLDDDFFVDNPEFNSKNANIRKITTEHLKYHFFNHENGEL